MSTFFPKQLLCFLTATLFAATSFAQSAAINTSGAAAVPSAALDITSNTKGLLIPRMTNASRNAIAAPATGLMIYQTDATAGFYYYNGAAWAAVGGGGGTVSNSGGTNNYITKWTTGGSVIGNSLMQDNGTSVSVGSTTPSAIYQLYAYRQQLTVSGDGQHSLFGYRTRDSQNDGTAYSQAASNSATAGYNFWGDLYTFGVGGYGYNDYTRTGGVLGAEVSGTYWGSLGYRNSGSVNYGVYGSAAYASGAGFTAGTDKQGVGGGFYGGMIGSWSHGEVMGQVNSGEMFATYNLGNVYTSGHTVDLVSDGTKKVAAYAVTSPTLKVYDDGAGQINGSEVFVAFNKEYAGMLGTTPNVTISAVGTPAQLYIKNITSQGFTVAVASGTANAQFSWIAIGNRVDAASLKGNDIPVEVTNLNFDAQLKGVMSNDGNKQETAKPIWYDGQKIRFDKAPEAPKAAKKELSTIDAEVKQAPIKSGE